VKLLSKSIEQFNESVIEDQWDEEEEEEIEFTVSISDIDNIITTDD
jgi:hypothetical protein